MILDLFWAPIAGALVGVIIGLTGVGGGVLMAPILLLAFGLDLQTVVATDLLFASITKLAAGGIHIRNQLVDWQIVIRLWFGSIPATFLIVALAQQGFLFKSPDWITLLLGGLISFSGLSLVFGYKLQLTQKARRRSSPQSFKRLQPPLTTLSGVILGACITITSIGAGALGAVFLRVLYPLRMEPKPLIATDTIHAIPISLLGGASFLFLGYTNLQILILLLVGSIPASILGSYFIRLAPINLIRNILSTMLLIIGATIVITS